MSKPNTIGYQPINRPTSVQTQRPPNLEFLPRYQQSTLNMPPQQHFVPQMNNNEMINQQGSINRNLTPQQLQMQRNGMPPIAQPNQMMSNDINPMISNQQPQMYMPMNPNNNFNSGMPTQQFPPQSNNFINNSNYDNFQTRQMYTNQTTGGN